MGRVVKKRDSIFSGGAGIGRNAHFTGERPVKILRGRAK